MNPLLLMIIIALCTLAITFWERSTYFSLIRMKTIIDSTWKNIDTLLKKRVDIITNLISIIQQYSSCEIPSVKTIDITSPSIQASADISQQPYSEDPFSHKIAMILEKAQSDSELLKNQKFKDLQQQLIKLDTQISTYQQIYNDTCLKYNYRISEIPINIIAKINNFTQQKYFETQALQSNNAHTK